MTATIWRRHQSKHSIRSASCKRPLRDFRFVPRDDIPHFCGLSFRWHDVVRFSSQRSIHPRDDLNCRDDVHGRGDACFDHRFRPMQTCRVGLSSTVKHEDAYGGAHKQIETLLENGRVIMIATDQASCATTSAEFKSNTVNFEKMVLARKEYIGDDACVEGRNDSSRFSTDPPIYRCYAETRRPACFAELRRRVLRTWQLA